MPELRRDTLAKAIDPFAFAAIERSFYRPTRRRLDQMQKGPRESKAIVRAEKLDQFASFFVSNRHLNFL